MRKVTPKLVWLLAFMIAPLAHAHVDCAGEFGPSGSGTIVKISLQTGGPMDTVQGGYVAVTPKQGSSKIYPIKAGDMSQYFEDFEDDSAMWVGASAYIDAVSPIFVKYRGPNYKGQDLTAVLRDKVRAKVAGNGLRVWKGPGYAPEEQFSFSDFVCTAFFD